MFSESGMKLGMVSFWGWPRPSNWKSNTFTKTSLQPLMREVLSISKLHSSTTILNFLLRYITLSYVIWLKNGRFSKFDQNIWIWPTAGWERNHPRPNIKKTIPAKVRPVSNTYEWGKFMKKFWGYVSQHPWEIFALKVC